MLTKKKLLDAEAATRARQPPVCRQLRRRDAPLRHADTPLRHYLLGHYAMLTLPRHCRRHYLLCQGVFAEIVACRTISADAIRRYAERHYWLFLLRRCLLSW